MEQGAKICSFLYFELKLLRFFMGYQGLALPPKKTVHGKNSGPKKRGTLGWMDDPKSRDKEGGQMNEGPGPEQRKPRFHISVT